MSITIHIQGTDYALPDGIHIAGRSSEADIIIDSGTVSSNHCRFTVQDKQLFIEDLGSKNGTRLNGTAVQGRQPVQPGDTITIGAIECQRQAAVKAQPAVQARPSGNRGKRKAKSADYMLYVKIGIIALIAFIAWQVLKGNPELEQAQARLQQTAAELAIAEDLPSDTTAEIDNQIKAMSALERTASAIQDLAEISYERSALIDRIEESIKDLQAARKKTAIQEEYDGLTALIASGITETEAIQMLLQFKNQHPDHVLGRKAGEQAEAIRQDIAARVEAAFLAADEQARALESSLQFEKAAGVWRTFRDSNPDYPHPAKITDKIDAVYSRADNAFETILNEARQAAGRKQFTQAREKLKPVIEIFGIYNYIQKAGELLTGINAQEDALHAADREHLAKIVAAVDTLLKEYRFKNALNAIRKESGSFEFDKYRQDLEGRVLMLEKIVPLKDAWVSRSAAFKQDPVSLKPFDLPGSLAGIDRNNLQIQAEEGAIIPFPFAKLNLKTFFKLTRDLICAENGNLHFALGLFMQETGQNALAETAFNHALNLDSALKTREAAIYAAIEQRRAMAREQAARALIEALTARLEAKDAEGAEAAVRELEKYNDLEVWAGRKEIMLQKYTALRAEAEQKRAAAMVSRNKVSGAYRGAPCLAKTVYSKHPRIFFREEPWANGPSLADIKKRSMVRLSAMAGDSNDGVAPSTGPGFALAWVKTGNKNHAERAIQWIKTVNGHSDVTGNTMNAAHCAIAYDWIYNYEGMTDEDRSIIEKKLIDLGQYHMGLCNGANAAIFHTRAYGSCTAVGTIGLVMHGHHGSARTFIDFAVKRYRDILFPARAHQGGAFQQGFSYGNHVLMDRVIEFVLAWESATGDPIFEEIKFKFGNFLEEYGYYMIYGLQPDDYYVAWGDFNRSSRGGITHEQRRHADVLFAKTGNPVFAAFGNYIGKKPEVDYAGPNLFLGNIYGWPKAAAPMSLIHKLPPQRLFSPGGLGHVFLRSGFQQNDIFIAYKCGNYYGNHGHFDQGSFVIYSRGNLALDSGGYTSGFSGAHRLNYYRKSIAHNTVVFPDTRKNDEGGQRIIDRQNIRSMNEYMGTRECHTGRITAYEVEPRYVHIASDVTQAYSSSVKDFKRQLVFLDKTYLIIYDRAAASPGLMPTWLLHTAREPKLQGQGFTVKEGSGTLQGITLLPRNAQVNTIGGPGKEFWVAGNNYPTPVSADNIPGAWRIEVSPPAADGRPAAFLHVLAPKGQLPACGLISEGGGGVTINGTRIIFAGDGQNVLVQ